MEDSGRALRRCLRVQRIDQSVFKSGQKERLSRLYWTLSPSIYPSFFYTILNSHTATSFLKTYLFLACVSCHIRLLIELFFFNISRFKWDKI